MTLPPATSIVLRDLIRVGSKVQTNSTLLGRWHVVGGMLQSQRLGRVLGLDWFAQSERNTYRTSNSSIFVPISDAKKFGAEYNRFLLIRAVSSTTWHWEKGLNIDKEAFKVENGVHLREG
ncbi:hypothetical protein OIU76_013258 [Salix suchowensis]|nr:hypothetical protein OIU76_013258 [Salix suchowensis]